MKMYRPKPRQEDMGFLIDFTLEIFHGCRWHCAGCQVDKAAQDGFEDQDYHRLLNLFDDLEANDHILSNLGLGPTDFMVADNTKELMPLLVPIMDRFHSIVFQCTFMEKPDTIREMAEFMKPYLSGREVKFVTPIDPKQFKNAKLFQTITRNRDLFVSLIPDMQYIKTNYVCNLVDLRDFEANPFHNQEMTLEEFCNVFCEHSDGNHLDLIISDGRLPLRDLNNRMRLKSTISYLNRLYNEGVDDVSRAAINFTLGDRHEGFDKDYVYRNGRIYSPVFVGEPLLMFEPEFSVDRSVEWTTASLVDFENQSAVDSLLYLDNTQDCATCEFAPLCVGRGVIKMMQVLKEKKCMAPRDAFISTRQQCA